MTSRAFTTAILMAAALGVSLDLGGRERPEPKAKDGNDHESVYARVRSLWWRGDHLA